MFSSSESIIIKDKKDRKDRKDRKDSHSIPISVSRSQHHAQQTILNRQRASTWSETQVGGGGGGDKSSSLAATHHQHSHSQQNIGVGVGQADHDGFSGSGNGGGGNSINKSGHNIRRKAKSFHHRRQHSTSSQSSRKSNASTSASHHTNAADSHVQSSPGATSAASSTFYSPIATPTSYATTGGGGDYYSSYSGSGSGSVSVSISGANSHSISKSLHALDNLMPITPRSDFSSSTMPTVEGMKEDHLKEWLAKNDEDYPNDNTVTTSTNTIHDEMMKPNHKVSVVPMPMPMPMSTSTATGNYSNEHTSGANTTTGTPSSSTSWEQKKEQIKRDLQRLPLHTQSSASSSLVELNLDLPGAPTTSDSTSQPSIHTPRHSHSHSHNNNTPQHHAPTTTFSTPFTYTPAQRKFSEMATPRASGARHLRKIPDHATNNNHSHIQNMHPFIHPQRLSWDTSRSISLPSTPSRSISKSFGRQSSETMDEVVAASLEEEEEEEDDSDNDGNENGDGNGDANNGHDGHPNHDEIKDPGETIGSIGENDLDRNVHPNSHRDSTIHVEEIPSHPHPDVTYVEMNMNHHPPTTENIIAQQQQQQQQQTPPEYPPNLNIVQGHPGSSLGTTWTDDTGSLDVSTLGHSEIGASGSFGSIKGGKQQQQQQQLSQAQFQEHFQDTYPDSPTRKAPKSLVLQDSDMISVDGTTTASVMSMSTKNVEQHLQSHLLHDNLLTMMDGDENVHRRRFMEENGGEMEGPTIITQRNLTDVVKETASSGIGDSEISFGSYESSLSTGILSEKMRLMSTSSDTTDLNVNTMPMPLRKDSSVYLRRQEEQARHGHMGVGHSTESTEDKGPMEVCLSWLWRKCWFCFNAPPKLSWSRVSAAVVRNTPCFWIGCGRLETSATDRMILTRLNMLSAVFALWQFSIGAFILVVFLSDTIADREGISGGEGYSKYKEALSPNFWMPSGCLLLLSVVGLLLFISMLLAIPAIRRVNLVGAIRFLWVLYWIIPLQICFVIALWDYHGVLEVWIKHWWASQSMAWFRKFFCEEDTVNEECAIRYFQTGDPRAEEWCLSNWNATNCQEIRDDAVTRMGRASNIFLYTNVIIGLVLVFILLLSLGLLEGIISAPIVQRSKETNIPFWLSFPAIGCFSLGFALRFSPSSLLSEESGSKIYWIGLSYIISGASFTISALLGWFISAKTVLNIRDKRQKEIAVYVFIIVVIVTIGAIACIFVASVIFSLVEEAITDTQRAIIACFVDAADSCSNCNCTFEEVSSNTCQLDELACPEWSRSDVTRIVSTQLKQSITLSAIFAIYAFTALRFGFMLRTSISRYEIDYV